MGFLRRKTLATVSGLLAMASILGCMPQLGCANVSSVQKPAARPWTQDRIWITFWSPPPAEDKWMATLKSENFNLTWTNEHDLDMAARHGLKVILLEQAVLQPEALDDPIRKAKLDAMIDRVKNHPALEAYFLEDEPSAKDFHRWARLVAYLRQRDPAHVPYINLFGNYAAAKHLGLSPFTLDIYRDYIDKFAAEVKPSILSYDHYEFLKKSDPAYFYLNLEQIRGSALRQKIPFMNIIQACEWDRTWRMPNAQELRMMVYTSLAYGARGIAYFHYWGSGYFGALYRDRKRMPVMDAIVRLNAEIATLSPILMSLDSVGVYHSGLLPVGTKRLPLNSQVKVISETPLVVALFTDKARKRYFMLSSRDYKLETVSNVVVRDAQSVCEFDRVKKSWKRLDGTNLHLRIAAGDGRLFRID
jgi:hypothetical protein